MARDLRYWDSDAFLGYFNQEPDKHEACESVLVVADNGRLQIVTSALTLAEVLYAKGHPRLPQDKRKMVEDFFKNPFISVLNVTRTIAEGARDIVWDHNVRPKDAIHVSTALVNKIPLFNTFDRGLLKKTNLIGEPPLRIEIPHEQSQRELLYKS